jgi:hypothetical protein
MDDRKDGIIWQKDAGVEIRQNTEKTPIKKASNGINR